MNRSVGITLIITAVILLLLFAIFGPRSGGRYNWYENYESDNKGPYGTYIIRQMLEGYFPNQEVQEIKKGLPESLPLHEAGKANYVFIGEAMFLDSADVSQLLKFVDNGNNVFIASKSLPFDLMFYVYFTECDYTPWQDKFDVIQDSMSTFSFIHPDLTEETKEYNYKFRKKERIIPYRWHYIDSTYFCGNELGFMELGHAQFNNGTPYINFARIRYENPENYNRENNGGFFYIHTNPLAFTNYHLLRPEAKAYTDRVFSHLKEGPIYWDNYSQTTEGLNQQFNRRSSNNRNPSLTLSDESPFQYILENQHLSWAWYTLMGLGLLYLMFRAKRRQRIIPVVARNKNSSLEFVATIGAMYHNKQNHRKLSIQKMKIFLADIRSRYQISTAHRNDAFIQQLSMHSGVDAERLRQFFKFYENIEKTPQMSDDSLLKFHQEMQDIIRDFK